MALKCEISIFQNNKSSKTALFILTMLCSLKTEEAVISQHICGR